MNTTDPTDAADTADLEARLRGALRADAERYTPDPDLRARVDHLAARPRRTVPILLAAAAAIAVVLVVGSLAVRREDASVIDMRPADGTSAPVTAPTTAGPAPTTAAKDPAVPPPTDPPGTATTSPSVTSPTATTPSDPAGILRIGGVGPVPFGGPLTEAVDVVTARIGPPLATYSSCGPRMVTTWGGFALESVDGKLVEWELLGDGTLDLRSDTGLGIGSTAADVQRLLPAVEIGYSEYERRPAAFLQGADGKWGALVDGDLVVAMHGVADSPATLPLLEACAGPWLFERPMHARGLGNVVVGTPTEPAVAALRALYGPETSSGTACVGDAHVFEHDGATTTVWTRDGKVALFSERPKPDQPVAIDVPAGQVATGMSKAQVRARFGDDAVGSPADPGGRAFHYEWNQQGEQLWVSGAFEGEGEDAVLVELGRFDAAGLC